MTKEVLFKNLVKVPELRGRANQMTDQKHVTTLEMLLDAGVSFKDPLKITLDNVVVGGWHRSESYENFFTKNKTLDTATVPVQVLNLRWYDGTPEERQRIVLEALKDNAVEAKKGFLRADVVFAVTPFIEDYDDAAIVQKFNRIYPARVVKMAIRDARDAQNQRTRHAILRDKKSGVSISTLNRRYGKEVVTDALDGKPKDVHDHLRLNKIKKGAETLVSTWGRKYNEMRDRYLVGTVSQVEFLKLASLTEEAVMKLDKKAKAMRSNITSDIQQNSVRVRATSAQ